MYSVMWSEHCSYKSSKIHLRQIGREQRDPAQARRCSSAWERTPAWSMSATGGQPPSRSNRITTPVVRRAVPGRGHGRGRHRSRHSDHGRPPGCRHGLAARSVRPKHGTHRRGCLPGVVAGIGGYGNCLGLPNIGGEVDFRRGRTIGQPADQRAVCRRACAPTEIKLARATGVGNRVILFGAQTGRDGIGGVSVLASATFDEGDAKRPSVQVGDPFAEKGPHRVLPRDLRRRSGRRHPRPRRRGVVVRHYGARRRVRVAYAHRSGQGSAAGAVDAARRRSSPPSPRSGCAPSSGPEHVDAFLAVCAKWDVLATRYRRR